MKLDEFEKNFFNQLEVNNKHFDKAYFEGEWRKEKMSYSLDSRRVIEGDNPKNIINYFKPVKAIDVGCGPGSLVALLKENGFDNCDGIDISEDAIADAPLNIKDRLHVGDSTEMKIQDDIYDLVICREVLEHLTIKQIVSTVKEMCRISNKYVYVTTRFHPNPRSIFDFTTEFEVDPTHISCLNIEMLRLIFILNNFKRSKELEQSIDWQNKGRVLVYQKNI
jgi:2-polyprenyl-3-methyl-5-hydroxy-6-metoxy-1,4-benzoquinol methylase